jgi:hypothetical protein
MLQYNTSRNNCCCCCCCRSSKLWAFYADLEESLGTLESAAAVYDAMLELRVATPQIILNYALMLQVGTHIDVIGMFQWVEAALFAGVE